MRAATGILTAFALTAAVLAQPATRRPTNIAALKQYPSFYHNRPILIVGTVSTTDKGIRMSNDDGAFNGRRLPQDPCRCGQAVQVSRLPPQSGGLRPGR